MKQSLLAIFIFLSGKAICQSTEGLTGIRDTSYTTYSAWLSTKKKFPDINIVSEFHSPLVKEDRGNTYAKVNKHKLKIDAFVPKDKSENHAAIMIIHGGGWRSGDRSQHYPMAQKLATLGYACFTPEYRLSTEALYPAPVYDLKAALRWIRKNAKKYHVDTSRICVLGFSAGGQLAALIGNTNNNPAFEGDLGNQQYSSAVRTIIDIDGTLSFINSETGEGDDSKKKSAATLWFGYSRNENSEMWKQASPLTYAGPHSVPTLFINSSVERMHAGREEYVKILTANNIYTEIFSFYNSPHSFCLFDTWFDPTIQYIDQFMKKFQSQIR